MKSRTLALAAMVGLCGGIAWGDAILKTWDATIASDASGTGVVEGAPIDTTESTARIGTGCWRAVPGPKTAIRLALAESDFPGQAFGYDFTIADIDYLAISTHKTGAEDTPDWFATIYTKPDGVDDDSWYGRRLTLEILYSPNLDAPPDQWNDYTTDTAAVANTFPVNDTNRGTPIGFYGQPDFDDIQAGPVDWSAYWPGADSTPVDYRGETVWLIYISTGNPWAATFDGKVDNLVLTLNNGDTIVWDLEAGPIVNVDTGEGFATFQAAMDDTDTLDGHTLEVRADIATTEGQVNVTKDLTIRGASPHTVTPTQDTGASGDARGWFLVQPGIVLHVQDLIFDGAGYLVYQGFRHQGSGSFTDCEFHNIKYNESGPQYSGVAIAAFGDGPVDCSGCVFDEIGRVGVLYFGTGVAGSGFADCSYAGKGNGDWLDYALDISAGASVTVERCTVTDCRGIASSDGSESGAILVTTYYAGGTAAEVYNCFLNDNTMGMAVGYDETDTAVVTVFDNDLSGNTAAGIAASGENVDVDASGNWWGAADPAEVALEVGDYVDYTPWLAEGDDTDSGTNGFQGDFSALWVDDDSPQTGDDGRVTEALGLVSGSAIHIAAGTYNEAITIDLPVELIGTDGAALDGTGLGLITGVLIHASDVTFENIDVLNFGGNGMIVGYEPGGPGNLQNVKIRNCTVAHIQPGSSHGFGIYVGYEAEAFWDETLTDQLDYTGLELTGNTVFDTAQAAIALQSIQSTGDPLLVAGNYLHDSDASGLWIDSARNILVAENRLESSAYGLFVSAYADGYYEGTPDTPFDTRDLAFERNRVLGNSDKGVAIYDGWPALMTFADNQFVGNVGFGVFKWSGLGGAVIDVRHNYWGDASGPEDPLGENEADIDNCFPPKKLLNADGLGDPVSDENADYCPWLPAPATLALLVQGGQTCFDTGETLVVEILMSNPLAEIVAGQYYLNYDAARLTFDHAEVGDEPFDFQVMAAMDLGGRLFYSTGVTPGEPGVMTDIRVAYLYFTVNAEVDACDLPALVGFEPDNGGYQTKLSDAVGAVVWPEKLDLPALTIDDVPTTITCPADISQSADAGVCAADVTVPVPTVDDNCGVASVTNDYTGTGDASGVYPVGTTEVVWTAVDTCGNVNTCLMTVTVTDDEEPTITCPGDLVVLADAGDCAAAVTVPAPVTADNCGVASVVNDFTGTADASGTYPEGATVVTWTVTDIHGNAAQCFHTVTVLSESTLAVAVSFDWPYTGSRCITFELWDCDTMAGPVVLNEVLDFVDGEAADTLVVPCGAYTCLTAQDTLHTLRRTVDVAIDGTTFTADFAGEAALVGGNLNNDFYIDVLDFGVFSWQWFLTYDSDGDTIPDGDTSCSTPYPHADVTGDGIVNTADFTFIQGHFLAGHEANCCGEPGYVMMGQRPAGRPVTAITVQALYARGMGELAIADLNHDGWLDTADIAEFVAGARPHAPEIEEAEAHPAAPGGLPRR